MNPRPVPFTQAIILSSLLIALVPLAGCQVSTDPGENPPANLGDDPVVTVREPAQIVETNGEVELTLTLSASVALPGETVQFEAAAQNLLTETLEFYGLVCWPDSPRFFLIDGAGTAYRVEWQPLEPCPAGVKHLPVGDAAASRDWFSGEVILDGAKVELPPGDYTARAVYSYRPLSAQGTQSSEIAIETPFRLETLPE